MRQISKYSVTIFLISALLAYSTLFISSCATPAKKAKPSKESSGYSDNLKSSNQTVEERLDNIYKRLAKIEAMVGISSDDEQTIDAQNIVEEEIFEIEDESSNLYSEQKEPLNKTASKSSSFSSNNYGASPEAQYRKARELLLANKFDAAEKEFRAIAQNYPKHPLAVNSFYWLGECRYSVKDYNGAIKIFKELVERYPNGRKVPDALLKTAYSYLSMNDSENASEYLKTVVKKFPFSPAGEKAEKKLQSLR
ncbi:MAG: tol-pal system protein YbgF [Desulfamplus sp.]|nr:tol-pal system protein YbgF [Desulfamplus sp.]